jgi:PKD repeat protein
LVQGSDGYFYGTTAGDATNQGTVFQLLIRPAITFTANPTSGIAPLSVNFTTPSTDAAGNSITQWNWSFGDGSTSTNQNPTHTYTTAGTFNPTLFATNSNGITVPGAGPASITVTPNTQPGISSVSLSGADLVLSATNGIAGNTYLVLASANLALPLSQWTPVATNILSANGSFTIVLPYTVNGNAPQQLYILESH